MQSEPHEIIVCCNHSDAKMIEAHRAITEHFGGKVYPTGRWGATCCYSSADMIVSKGIVKGEWLCFPSDDSIYFACFSDLMLRAARQNNWDLVYCDCVYDPLLRLTDAYTQASGTRDRYGILDVKPRLGHIDKTGFLVKKKWFDGFPGKRRGPSAADGLFIEELVNRGIRHGKANGVLLVHQ